jgi:hypothetical protein
MDEGAAVKPAAPQFSSEPQPVAIQYVPGHVTMLHLSREKVNSLSGCGDRLAIHLTFLGIFVGAFLSLGGILWLTPPEDPKKYATVFAVSISSVLLTIFFGIMAATTYFARRRELRELQPSAAPSPQAVGE